MTVIFTEVSSTAMFALVAAPLNVAHAGLPFGIDDPEPTGYGHFKIHLYSQGTAGVTD